MSASTNMRVQKQRENALRRMLKDVPAAIREAWGQHDYTRELQAREPHLFSSMIGANADRFYRLAAKVAKIPLHGQNDDQRAMAAAVNEAASQQHTPYVEPAPKLNPLDQAWADMQQRVDKECEAITGTAREMQLHKGQLNLCPAYQRDYVNPAKVEKIAMALDRRAFNRMVVSHRDDKYWIVDGQHRWLAACSRNDMDQLPCLVYDSKGEKEDAQLFMKINMNRTVVGAHDRFRALLAGGDEIALEVASCLEMLDITVMTRASRARQMSCISKVFALAKRDMRHCELVLSVTQALSTAIPVSGDLVSALSYIDRNTADGLDNPVLQMRLKKLGIHKILDVIQKAKTGRGQPAWIMLIGEVNKGLPKTKRILLRNMVEMIDDDDD